MERMAQQFSRNVGLLRWYEQKERERIAKEEQRKLVEAEKGKKTTKNIGSLAFSAGKIYDKMQEGNILKSGVLNKELYWKDVNEQLNPIKLAERTPIEGKGFFSDMINRTFTPSGQRVRIRPEVQDMLLNGELFDATGEVITSSDNIHLQPIKDALHSVGSTAEPDAFTAMNVSSQTPNIGSTVTSPSGVLKSTYWQGLEKGTKLTEKLGAAGNIAATVGGVARVFGEKEAHEKVHGAVQAIAPVALKVASGASATAAAPWAAPAVAAIWAVNTIWDLFD